MTDFAPDQPTGPALTKDPLVESAENTHVTSGWGSSQVQLSSAEEVLRVDDLTVGFPTEDGLVQRRPRRLATRCARARCSASSASPARASRCRRMAVMGLLPKSATHHRHASSTAAPTC